MSIRVTTIPATVNKYTASAISSQKKRRAAAYARVSTDREEQLTSYAAQVGYYTDYIKKRGDLEFVSVYADEGISGTSTCRREGFKRMIADALAGKIDLIITKSVSRFARNTVDSLSTIRMLKAHNVECYFEKENIRTFDGRGELLLSIMASIAQEESRSISENCTWGQRKRFSDGKVTVPFSRFLGYDRGADGQLVINPEEAKLVRKIYGLFLGGLSPHAIAARLTEENIPTPGGKRVWHRNTVRSILSNEKYKGDALLQKVYTVDFLTKKKKINEGEVPQYYVEGGHEAIVSKEVFEMAQDELERRAKSKKFKDETALFSGKIFCGCCGGEYVPKIIRSTNQYRAAIWQCGCKAAEKTQCAAPHLVDEEIRAAFVRAANKARSGASEELLTGFDRELWLETLERITVYGKKDIRVVFRDGTEARVEL